MSAVGPQLFGAAGKTAAPVDQEAECQVYMVQVGLAYPAPGDAVARDEGACLLCRGNRPSLPAEEVAES